MSDKPQIQACREADRQIAATPAGAEMIQKAAAIADEAPEDDDDFEQSAAQAAKE